jgi:hypothetical protein
VAVLMRERERHTHTHTHTLMCLCLCFCPFFLESFATAYKRYIYGVIWCEEEGGVCDWFGGLTKLNLRDLLHVLPSFSVCLSDCPRLFF